MRIKLYKLLCLLCSLFVLATCISVYADNNIDDGTLGDRPNGRMSAVYGYVLNDYINTYGVISTEHQWGNTTGKKGRPEGVIYADIVNFDNNENPYLVIFVADGSYSYASCHIWSYNEEKEKAKRIAVLNEKYSDIRGRRGGFFIGWDDNKRYILYKEFSGDRIYSEECYTVINGEAFRYVNAPSVGNDVAVIDFNNAGIRSYTDISGYNVALTKFFDSLKNAAAESVTYEDIADKITGEEAELLEKTAANAAGFDNFNIEDYSTIEEYEAALKKESGNERFYLISNIYALGDEMYYVRFSTDISYYNYVLLRRTDREEEKYQILKVRKDCIPLSDRELRQLKDEYLKSTLLYKKAKDSLIPQGEAGANRDTLKNDNMFDIPKIISIPKVFDARITKPAALLGAAVVISMLVGLWIYFLEHDDGE